MLKRLQQEDDFLVSNIKFVKRRSRFKTMLSKLELDSAVGTALSLSWNTVASPDAPADEEEIRKQTPVHDSAPSPATPATAESVCYSEDASLASLGDNAELVREMCLSTAELLGDTVRPRLLELNLGESGDAFVRTACEATLLVLTFTECIIAPRLRHAAASVQETLIAPLDVADREEMDDEAFIARVSSHAADVAPEALAASVTQLCDDIDDFVLGVRDHYARPAVR